MVFALYKLFNIKAPSTCCCCGFSSYHGVFVGSAGEKVFACFSCFSNPNMFFTARRILPHQTLAVKTQERINGYAKNFDGSPVVSSACLTKKSKREYAMSESLYSGQTQLF
ncbi:MAG: hypothetical protein WC325_10740 [Candidatus Bathyarchaeia archaeon]|jgi:hypothetical protein